MAIEPFYLTTPRGRRFCIYHAARDSLRGAVVYVHPFAEELNRSRRIAAHQARMLAGAGYAVLQIDLHGCGDSAGDFGDATWASWIDDVMCATRWLRDRNPAPLWYWGLRAGCLLAAEAASAVAGPVNFLLWQPVLSGGQHLQHWLRVRLAADMLGDPSRTLNTGDLRRQLNEGNAIEVAGYSISPGLADALSASSLTLPESTQRVICMEVLPGGGQISPLLEQQMANWRDSGHDVSEICVDGEQFWLAPDSAWCPELASATLSALNGRAE